MLHIFAGQGVKHGLGYGYISRVPSDREKAKQVMVRFESGRELLCQVSNLERAEMPEAELQALREKYGMVEAQDGDK